MAASDEGTRLPAVGWREWVGLPDLDIEWIKAKADTGARSSALHTTELETFERDGRTWVRFLLHPWQKSDRNGIEMDAPLVELRSVRSSNGHEELRPVIETGVRIGHDVWPTMVTLTSRDQMGFRLLLGRQTLRGHHLVDPDRSYLTARPPRSVIRANRGRSPA